MKNDSEFEFNELNERQQSLFNALTTQAFEQSQIETDFNELHAMYPFLPIDPPIDKSVYLDASVTAANVNIPTHCKIMRFTNGSQVPVLWSSGGGGGNGAVSNTEGRGWVIIPPWTTSPWIYCGNLLQIAVCTRSAIAPLSVEFASVHARKRG